MVIYKAEFPNGKVYIGKTINFELRKYHHVWNSNRDNKNPSKMARAICKYGSENINWSIIFECKSIEEMNKKEIEYIKLFNSTDHNFGYNMVCGDKEEYVLRDNFDEEYRIDIIKRKLKSNGHNPDKYVIIDDNLKKLIIMDYPNMGIRGLSKKYGISRQRLRRFLLANNIQVRKDICIDINTFTPSDELIDKVKNYFESGISIKKIAEMEDLTIMIVSRILHDSGVRKSKRFKNGKRYDGKQPKSRKEII